MEDFAEASDEFIKLGIATQVPDAENLGGVWVNIMEMSGDDDETIRRLSEQYFERSSGSSVRTWERIYKYCDPV